VRTNLILQSETFDNAYWTKQSASSVTANSVANPIDGAVTADTLTVATTTYSGLYGAGTGNGNFTQSIYAKKNTIDFLYFFNPAGTSIAAWFNLANGTLGQVTVGYSANIESVGNGWYRCSIRNTASESNNYLQIGLSSTDGSNTPSAAGSAYIFGAQSELSDIATDYIATTTAAVSVGPVANVPRLDYLGSSCPRLLLEPQRTNAFLYSNQPEGTGWDRVNCTLQTGFAGPDGYNSARKFTATSNDSVFYYQNTSVTSGTSYTASVYVKSAGKRYFQITGSSGFAGNEYVNFDLQTGTIVYESGSALTGKIEALTDGWYRVSVTQIATSTTSGRFILALIDTATAGRLGVVTADGNGILVWEHQMEASSYPTSIIPTLGSAVTRLADSASKRVSVFDWADGGGFVCGYELHKY
jgi:hypothetical protein